jgi:hypothetical protein
VSFEKAYEKLENAVKDLTTLTVRTFSADLTAVVSGPGVDFDKLVEKAQTDGKVSLEMQTEIMLDSDTDMVIGKDVAESVRSMHRDAVEAAQRSRQAMLDLIVRTIRGKG